jgi:sortase (surface protein transpeptidase)
MPGRARRPTDRPGRRRSTRTRAVAATGILFITLTTAIAVTVGVTRLLGDTGPSATDLIDADASLTSVAPAVVPSRPTAPEQTLTAPNAHAMDGSMPVRLRIPAIDVDSSLVALGLQSDGTLEVPEAGFPAGWFTGAPTPGELGPAIIAGHVDWGGSPGVFFDLHRLTVGDVVLVDREDGTTAQFRITTVLHVAKETFPTAAVYGDVDHAGLRLITCGGDFDRSLASYDENVIVFAELLEPGSTAHSGQEREE